MSSLLTGVLPQSGMGQLKRSGFNIWNQWVVLIGDNTDDFAAEQVGFFVVVATGHRLVGG